MAIEDYMQIAPGQFHRRTLISAAIGWFGLGASACEVLAQEDLIRTPRVLAIRTTVREPWIVDSPQETRERADALPFDTLAFSALIAGPHGLIAQATWPALWIVCTAPDDDLGCIAKMRENSELASHLPKCLVGEAKPKVVPNLQDDPSDPTINQRPCVLDSREGIDLSYTVRQRGRALRFAYFTAPPNGPTPLACADAFIAARNDFDPRCLQAISGLHIGPERTLRLLHGLSLLTDEEVPELRQTDDPLSDAFPSNRHPRPYVAAITAKIAATTWTSPFTTPIEVVEGDELAIEVEVPKIDWQSFVSPVDSTNTDANGDSKSSTESSETTSSNPQGSVVNEALHLWTYRTWGVTSPSNPGDAVALGQVASTSAKKEFATIRWNLRREAGDPVLAPDRLAHLYFVVRDLRDGIGWTSLSVRVIEPNISP